MILTERTKRKETALRQPECRQGCLPERSGHPLSIVLAHAESIVSKCPAILRLLHRRYLVGHPQPRDAALGIRFASMLPSRRDHVQHRSSLRLDTPHRCREYELDRETLKDILRESLSQRCRVQRGYRRQPRVPQADIFPEEAAAVPVKPKASRSEQSAHRIGSKIRELELHRVQRDAPHSSDGPGPYGRRRASTIVPN